jgi:hypothetical protein
VRVLAIPTVTALSGETESDLSTQLSILRAIGQCESSYGYLWGRGIDEGRIGHDTHRQVFHEEATPNSFYALTTAVTGRLYETFNRITGLYPVDAVLTSRVGLVASLMVGLQGRPDSTVPVITAEPRVYAPGDVAHHQVGEVAAAARALGYSLAHNVFWSEWERDAAYRAVDMWLSPAALRRTMERSRVIRLPVQHRTRLPSSSGRKRLIFAGRLNSNKRWRDVLDAYRQVYQSRQDVGVHLHSGTGAFQKVPVGADWYTVSERFPTVDEWLRLLASSDIGAYASKDEGSNLTVLEMVAAGVVLALPRAPWVDKLFHPHEYPFRFKSVAELPALLDWMIDHEGEARHQLEPIRRFVKQQHAPDKWTSGWCDLVKTIHAENNDDPLYTFREDVADLLTVQQSVSFATAVEAGRIGQTIPNQRQVFNHYDAWRAVRDLDDHLHAVPILRRPKERNDG